MKTIKNNIFRFLLLIVLLIAPVVIFSPTVRAVDLFPDTCNSTTDFKSETPAANVDAKKSSVCTDVAAQTGKTQNPIIKIIGSAIKIVSYLIGVAAIIGIIVSGIRMIVSSGSAESVASAKKGLYYCLIGVAVAILAQTIVVYILNKI